MPERFGIRSDGTLGKLVGALAGQPVPGIDYPTDSQLKAALRTLVDAIPKEGTEYDDETRKARELLWEFIDYHAQPDEPDAEVQQ